MVFLFDLDGTLADIEHRRHLVSGGNADWDLFYELCLRDAPNVPIIDLYRRLQGSSPTAEMWIFSGRSEVVRNKTLFWFREHHILINPENLIMRPVGDYTPDDALKLRWLDEYGLRERIVCVFDDRQKVVDMWRREGLTCLQVAPGNF